MLCNFVTDDSDLMDENGVSCLGCTAGGECGNCGQNSAAPGDGCRECMPSDSD